MTLKIITSCLIMLIVFASCGSKGSQDDKLDERKPVIHVISPVAESVVKAGGILNVNIDVEDNIALKDYLLQINISGTKALKTVEEYSFNSMVDKDQNGNALPQISGEKTAKLNFGIKIDELSKEGNYSLTLMVSDETGNEEEALVDFYISRI